LFKTDNLFVEQYQLEALQDLTK